jgi:hypothetical protein
VTSNLPPRISSTESGPSTLRGCVRLDVVGLSHGKAYNRGDNAHDETTAPRVTPDRCICEGCYIPSPHLDATWTGHSCQGELHDHQMKHDKL